MDAEGKVQVVRRDQDGNIVGSERAPASNSYPSISNATFVPSFGTPNASSRFASSNPVAPIIYEASYTEQPKNPSVSQSRDPVIKPTMRQSDIPPSFTIGPIPAHNGVRATEEEPFWQMDSWLKIDEVSWDDSWLRRITPPQDWNIAFEVISRQCFFLVLLYCAAESNLSKDFFYL